MTNKTFSRLFAYSGLAVLMAIMVTPSLVLAQTTTSSFGDDQLSNTLGATDRGFPTNAMDTIVAKEFPTDLSVTFAVPAVKKSGQVIKEYFINLSENSFASVKDGNAAVIGEKEILINDYEIVGETLVFTVKLTSKTQKMYMTISPTSANAGSPRSIVDYSFTLKELQQKSGYKGMVADATSDANPGSKTKAISNINCIRDEKLKKITVRWLDTGLANKIAISYKAGTEQGELKLQDTVPASNEKFTFNVTEVKIPYLDLQPQDSAGDQVGVDFRFECKADEHDVATPKATPKVDPKTPVKKIITKVPHTGPVETMGGLLLATVLLYGIYRRMYRLA